MDLEKEAKETQKKFDEMTNKVKYADYMFPFGKYKGVFIADVWIEDPDYVFWMYERCNGELLEAIRFHIEGGL